MYAFYALTATLITQTFVKVFTVTEGQTWS
jgi:hypothetical protein